MAPGGELLLRVPDASHAKWLEENFMQQIQSTLALFAESPVEVRLVADNAAAAAPAAPMAVGGGLATAVASAPAPQAQQLPPVAPPELVARYRFDRFVDGPNNQFAFTAAKASAERPGRQYNPLFLYGGVGLGKTHLLHAVGHAVLEANPAARIVYVTSETFVNDLIAAIRKDKMHQFRTKYRDACDVLLIDDIQFIAGKDRTQEEFFHLFNTLHSSHKQIVMTCDQVPRSIPDMEDRLKSRLEWGLIADIKPPSFETRVAILKRKAEADRVDLPDDVAMLLARHINRNVRELEGALMRLVANARIFESPISIGMTREVLGDLVSDDVRRVSADTILKTVAHEYRIGVADLKATGRPRPAPKSASITTPSPVTRPGDRGSTAPDQSAAWCAASPFSLPASPSSARRTSRPCSARCRAATNPSPPLLPGPQRTSAGPGQPRRKTASATARPAFSISSTPETPASMARRSARYISSVVSSASAAPEAEGMGN